MIHPQTVLLFILSFLISTSQSASADESKIRIDGSSTVYPLAEAFAEEFQLQNDGIDITIGVSGTGGGFKKFCEGELEIVTASRRIQPSERVQCEASGISFNEIEIAKDAIVLVVNPENSWATCFTIDELRDIFQPSAQGRIVSWNQVSKAFPDKKLSIYGPGTDSGTFDYFTEVIVGRAKESRGDYTASEDDNVLVQGVAGDIGALGYFSYSYYAQNRDKLRSVAIKNSGNDSTCVIPDPLSIEEERYRPLSRPLFFYVKTSPNQSPVVSRFIDFVLNKELRPLISEIGFVPVKQKG